MQNGISYRGNVQAGFAIARISPTLGANIALYAQME